MSTESTHAPRQFFAIDDPNTGQLEPLDLDELELVLRDQPDDQELRMAIYELPSGVGVVKSYDASIEDDVLTVGVGDENVKVGKPVEWLVVTHHGDRITIFDQQKNPVARCDNCNGLIRNNDMSCPTCSWNQWAQCEGFIARPLKKK